MKSVLALAAFALAGAASAQQGTLKVTEPRADHWWVSESLNTLAWTGETGAPTTFSVFLNNPDPQVLTSKYALVSVQQLYEYSKTVNPGAMKASTGYTIELTDTLNSSNIYATSETFEIKARGSPYPPQGSPTAVAGSASGNSASGPTNTSAGSAQPSVTGGAMRAAIPGIAGAVVAGGLALVL